MKCEECGEEFEQLPIQRRGRKQRFCSPKCGQKNWRDRHPKRARSHWRKARKKLGKEYWREYYRKLKIKLINAMGGCCEKCYYRKCFDALEIHHVDRSVKEGQTNSGHLTPSRVKTLIQQWKEGKVKLLCANCHREEHAKINSV